MSAVGAETGAMASFKKSFENLKGTSHSAAKGAAETTGTDGQDTNPLSDLAHLYSKCYSVSQLYVLVD